MVPPESIILVVGIRHVLISPPSLSPSFPHARARTCTRAQSHAHTHTCSRETQPRELLHRTATPQLTTLRSFSPPSLSKVAHAIMQLIGGRMRKMGRARQQGRVYDATPSKDDPRRGNARGAASLRQSDGVLSRGVHVFDTPSVAFCGRGHQYVYRLPRSKDWGSVGAVLWVYIHTS